MSSYDVITVGGGWGGATLARSLAAEGMKVLVLERETQFRDRVRGEGLLPWGTALTQDLDLYDLLLSTCAHQTPFWDVSINGSPPEARDFFATTPRGVGCMSFYHPDVQEVLLAAAEDAGAEVRRGVTVTGVATGATPSVTVQGGNGLTEIGARLIVGADGRNSRVRGWGGFSPERDDKRLQIAGLLMSGMKVDEDAVTLRHDTIGGRGSICFPMIGGRARIYFIRWHDTDEPMLSGDKDVARFVDECIACGQAAEAFGAAEAAGPLAMFEGAETRVEHPHHEGVVLIGDAATSTDPSWGNGLALTLYDVRELRDQLAAHDDWGAAADAYAGAHDKAQAALNAIIGWLTDLFYEPGAEATERRGRAFEGIAADPLRVPDVLALGPEAPCDEAARRRFFSED